MEYYLCYRHDLTDTYEHWCDVLENFKEDLDGVGELIEIVTENIVN